MPENNEQFGLPAHVINQLQKLFQSHPSVECAVVYGSRAKGNYKKGSDIDLSLKGNVTVDELLRIDNEIDDLLLPWMFDLSIYSKLRNHALVEHIDRVGKVLYTAP
jgi:predicted nucleotidyltransferase